MNGSLAKTLVPGELVARLEAASVGSREMDHAVLTAFGLHDISDRRDACDTWRLDGAFQTSSVYVTQSIADALAFAVKVLPGQSYREGWPGQLNSIQQFYNGQWGARTYRVGDGASAEGVAATPALALCIAILKARTPAEADGEKP